MYDKIHLYAGVNEKLRSEWAAVNTKFTHRKSVWEECTRTLHGLEAEYKEIAGQIKTLTGLGEDAKSSISYSRISQVRGRLVKYLARAKVLKPRFSSQESAKLQLKVDLLSKHWTDMFERLVSQTYKTTGPDRQVQQCLDQWFLEAQVYVSSCPVDGSDWDALYRVTSTVTVLEREIETVSDVVTSSNSLIKLKRDVTLLTQSVAKLKAECDSKAERLEKLEGLMASTASKMGEVSRALQHHPGSPGANALVAETGAKMDEFTAGLEVVRAEARVGGSAFLKKASAHVKRWEDLVSKTVVNGNNGRNLSPKAVKSAAARLQPTTVKQYSLETEKSFVTTEEECSRTTYSHSQSSFYSEEAQVKHSLFSKFLFINLCGTVKLHRKGSKITFVKIYALLVQFLILKNLKANQKLAAYVLMLFLYLIVILKKLSN